MKSQRQSKKRTIEKSVSITKNKKNILNKGYKNWVKIRKVSVNQIKNEKSVSIKDNTKMKTQCQSKKRKTVQNKGKNKKQKEGNLKKKTSPSINSPRLRKVATVHKR